MMVIRTVIAKLRPKTRAKSKRDAVEKAQLTATLISKGDLLRMREASTIVSDPQDVSNLRRVLLRIRSDETESEKVYRDAYEDVQVWNHRYWMEHNRLFHKQRADFINENATPDEPQLDAEKMSLFYRTFLDDNRDKHWRYNLEWYRKHFALLPLDMKARLSRLKLRFTTRTTT